MSEGAGDETRLGTGLAAILVFLLYLGSVALAYGPAFRPDALRTAVTVTDVSPAGGPAPFRFFPALPGPKGNVTEMAAAVVSTPRLALFEPAWKGYERARAYILWVTEDSFWNDSAGRLWVDPFDVQEPTVPLTLKQQRALLAPANAVAWAMGWPAAILGGLIGLWWWRRWSGKALLVMVAAWALLGGGVYGGGYLAGLGA
ncbi:MAG: hypothetical protein QXO51_00645 [Halobacteria archaeon]